MQPDIDHALKALGLHLEEAGLVAFLPLVEVAWADGEIQPAERKFILQKAEERLPLSAHGREVLEGWLAWRPSEATMALGRSTLEELSRTGVLPEDWGRLAEGVAKSSGGVLGLGAVDAREREVLERVQASIETGQESAVTVQAFDVEDDEPITQVGPSPLLSMLGDWQPPTGDAGAMLVMMSDGDLTQLSLGETGARIGRSRSCAMKIAGDSQVSREHCQVVERDGHWVIEDLGSANGTFVNGDRIAVRRLVGGEEIRVGSAVLRFLAPQD